MQIIVTRGRDGRQLTLEVKSSTLTVSELKDAIALHELGLPAEQQRLAVATSSKIELLGPRTLADYGIGKEAELVLSERPAQTLPVAPEQGS
eukprot:COSAG02_NODE_9022_length_2358_cov_0.951306_1_plen_91_part_10